MISAGESSRAVDGHLRIALEMKATKTPATKPKQSSAWCSCSRLRKPEDGEYDRLRKSSVPQPSAALISAQNIAPGTAKHVNGEANTGASAAPVSTPTGANDEEDRRNADDGPGEPITAKPSDDGHVEARGVVGPMPRHQQRAAHSFEHPVYHGRASVIPARRRAILDAWEYREYRLSFMIPGIHAELYTTHAEMERLARETPAARAGHDAASAAAVEQTEVLCDRGCRPRTHLTA